MSRKKRLEHGTVLEVNSTRVRDELAAAALTGATTITVDDASPFNDDGFGGWLYLNGQVIEYSDVDDDTGAITLLDALDADAVEGDDVFVWDEQYTTVAAEKLASVRLDGEDSENTDPIAAEIADNLLYRLPDGIRGTDGESVLLEKDGSTWRIIDVLGQSEAPSNDVRFFQDSTTVTVVGDQVVDLTYEPIEHSEHLYWNGLYQPGTEWIRTGQTVDVPDPGELIAVDDVLTVEYAYRDGGVAPAADAVPVSTRYYFPSVEIPVGGPPITPAYGEMWHILDEDEYTYRTRLEPSPTGISDLLGAIMPEAIASPVNILRGQFIAEETLGAGIVSGSMRMVTVIGTSNTAADSHLVVRIFVVSNDGTTERCELFVGTAFPEATDSATTRRIEGSLTPGEVQDGDRLVVEVGAAHHDGIDTLFWSSVQVGEGNSGVDHEFENFNTAGPRPWLDLTLVWDA